MKKIIIIIIIISCFLCACNSEKKSIKQDTKAVDRVLGSKKLLDNIAPTIFNLYPCINDTVNVPGPSVFIPGKDSSYPIFFTITNNKFKSIDTIIAGNRLLVDTSGKVKLIVKKQTPDTIKISINNYITDNRKLDFLKKQFQDSCTVLTLEHNTVNTYKQNEKQLKYIAKLLVNYFISKWWFWLLVLATIYFYYRKIFIKN